MAVTWTAKTPAVPGSSNLTGVTSSQGFNEAGSSSPSGSDGIQLRGLGSVQVEVIAPGVETFTGAGALLAFHINDTDFDANSAWMPMSSADVDMSGAQSKTSQRFTIRIEHPAGRLALLASNVGHSGAGSTMTVNLYGAPPATRHS